MGIVVVILLLLLDKMVRAARLEVVAAVLATMLTLQVSTTKLTVAPAASEL